MKLFLKKICLLQALFILLFASCISKSKGKLRIILDLEPLPGYSAVQLKDALNQRIIANAGEVRIENIEIKVKQALIEIDEIPDDSELIQTIVYSLPQKGKGIQFYETYEASEIVSPLIDFSKKFKIDEFDSLAKALQSKKVVTLEERVAHKKDSADLEFKRTLPFGGILSLNMILNEDHDQVFQPGSVLGYCKIKDSTALFQILDSAQKSNVFPPQLVIKTLRSSYFEGQIEIHTLRLTPPKNKPAMEGDIIESALKEYSSVTGEIFISLQFKPPFVEPWRLLTKRAAPEDINGRGKSVAIVYDDQLLSAPTVNGEIPNGNTQLTGNYTNKEAGILASKLNSGIVPCVIKLNHYEFIPSE